ncbi:hypothetical protein SAMN05216480_10412 [Pustulibacterium marinum]|uniref:Uncharacterized protein n=1 Tax=Pustulibacterium marinum TaxID=1224947 RepID=A0A1I7G9V9_9FLAO|nr:hypothetical protein [Pustulibacterium marinum]SFU45227.1 hypothetical protein SAMN05216480_10412 [Pustulibacterium marinum]
MKFLKTLLNQFGNGINNEESLTFEEQLEVFHEIGFRLNYSVTKVDLDIWDGGLKEYEEHPYELLYITFGQYADEKFEQPFSNNCWDFDLEELKDVASHSFVLRAMSRISNKEIQLSNIKCVESDEHETAIIFECNGDSYQWSLDKKRYLTDRIIFHKVKELAKKYKTKGKYTSYATGGHDFVMGFMTPDEFKTFKQKTGLDIEWL